MEITKPEHTRLMETLRRFQAEDGLEFESMIKGPLDQDAFQKVIRYLQAHADSRLPETRTLDIRVEHIPELVDARYHIEGLDAVLTYARTNKVVGGTADIKSKAVEAPITMVDYGVKWSLRREQPLVGDDVAPLVAAIENLAVPKHYRFKLRYSFLIADGALRVDATAVKQATKLATSFKASGVHQIPETYEIEVEAVKGAGAEDPEALLATWTSFLAKLLCIVRNQPVLIRQKDTDAVLESYLRLAYPQKTPSSAAARERPKSYFLAPRIMALKLKHIIEPDIDTISIYKDYTVTDKADGEHALLFVDSAGKIFLINDRLRVTYTGLRHKTDRLSIYDGEFITRGRHGTRLQLFALFDAFYVNGRGIWEQPLMSAGAGAAADTRLGAAAAFVDAGVDRTAAALDITFQVKPFYAGNGADMAAAVKHILNHIESGHYPYETDGLVFTPISMPPPLYPGGQTWNETFKWKPAKDNTIDFLVEYERAADPLFVDNRPYLVAHLYVAFKPYYDAVDPVEILSGRPPKAAYIVEKKLFTTCYLPLEDDLRTTLTVEREPIRSGTVVEFAYDVQQARDTLRWVAKRVRHDKNQLAADTQRIQANAWKTAVDTMDSIDNPVTVEHITSETPLSRKDYLDDNVYYARTELRRDLSLLKPLRDFHNTWVKERSLLQRFKGRAQSLLDLGMGQGGDIHKWANAEFSMVVGVDAAADGILKGENGAYDRLRKEVELKRHDLRRMRRLFLVLDMGKSWTPEYVQQSHEATRYLAQIAFGIGVKRDRIPERSLQPFYQVMRDGFDVVSCQFAVHYMFGSTATLEAFCGNLVRHMKPGGYFIGTTMDGAEVKRALRGVSRGQWIEWREGDQVLWRIVKEYEGDGSETRLGQRITNYMQSIGQQISEYLVDFDYMCEVLARYGIVPLTPAEQHELGVTSSSGLFRELFRELQDAAARGQAEHKGLQSALQMNDAMRQYSFLNRWFIFRRSA